MGENSKIEWTDNTFNPWWGCQKVSPACDHCYAEALDKRFGGDHWGPHAERRRTSAANWKQPLKWNARAEREGKHFRVFCASMADVFDNQAPPEWRADLWNLISETPNLDWLILTKRPQNIAKMLPENWHGGWFNVWLGMTAENHAEYTKRVNAFLAVPAHVHFISAEPLLGPIDFQMDLMAFHKDHMIDWIIAGGESGPDARPMHPDWPRSIRDQCADAGIPFLFKQWGEYSCDGLKVGKKSAGRILDGRTYDQFPASYGA